MHKAPICLQFTVTGSAVIKNASAGCIVKLITMKENICAAENEKIDNETAERGIKRALNRCINLAALYSKEQNVFIIIDIHLPLLVYTLDCTWNLPLHPRP